MEHGDDCTDGEGQLEAERDENQDAENSEPEGDERISRQFATDERANTLGSFHLELRLRHRLRKLAFDLVAGVERRANGDVILAALRRLLDGNVLDVHGAQGVAHLPDVNLLGRAEGHEVAAPEIDAEI